MNIKIRVFRCRGNQRDFSSFNIIEEGLLLLFREILNLIKIKQNAVYRRKRIQLSNDRLDIRC